MNCLHSTTRAPDRRWYTSRAAIGLVVRTVQRGGGSILFADRVNGARASEAHRRTPDARAPGKPRGPSPIPIDQRVIDNRFRRGRDERLGQRGGLRQQRPGPEREREACIRAIERIHRWNDVEQRQALDTLRMIEGEPIGDASAPVVTRQRKPIEAEACHHLDHVARHCPFGVRRMIGRGGRLPARAITSQVGADHREIRRQRGRHRAPHDVRLRKAMEQQQRGTASRMTDEDLRLIHFDRR